MEETTDLVAQEKLTSDLIRSLGAILSSAAKEQDLAAIREAIAKAEAVASVMDRLTVAVLKTPKATSPGTFPQTILQFDDLVKLTKTRLRRPIPAALLKRLQNSLVAARDGMARYVKNLDLHASRFDPLLPETFDESNLKDLFALWATPNN